MMKNLWKLIPCLFFLMYRTTCIAQEEVKPFDEFEPIAFCSFNQYHPFDYIRMDNNWQLLYALRTPQTPEELKGKGYHFNSSQLNILLLGGLLEMKGRQCHTTLPIFDQQQTTAIRALSRRLAEQTMGSTEQDYKNFVKALDRQGYRDNAFSLLFSFLLDGMTWRAITPPMDKISHQLTWDGIAFVQYEPRKHMTIGTNGYGLFNMTWSDSLGVWPKRATIDRFTEQFQQHGRVVDTALISELEPLGLVNQKGEVRIPVISNLSDKTFQTLTTTIIDKNAKGLAQGLEDFKQITGITDDNYAKVILFHEMMWDTLDLLLARKIVTEPSILLSKHSDRRDLRRISFFLSQSMPKE